MSLINLFGNRAICLTPAFIQSVQARAIEAGCAHIKVNGCCYTVSHIKPLDGFCVQSAGKSGLLGRLWGCQRGLEGRVSALELMLNKNQNPIKAHNEFINKIFESSI
ncbi:hypothetical protein [Escherichia coli]|uniref:hypothetical protein n=1 Tax=Escherichia coli TaxID=562 RepID=UPI001694B412|nr:hypothetical protein [Escherichia coli]EEU9261820.1 hypothetical protein [Escherichia coli]EFJ1803023.1 hypothetical protein [Escherichia coli]EFO4711371.1 hypothetical protein [Escherichia coli]EIR2337745.1 hypothetical protein [Escherichia coli]MCQ0121248.1 hypothetical protein [Escherichia coli]